MAKFSQWSNLGRKVGPGRKLGSFTDGSSMLPKEKRDAARKVALKAYRGFNTPLFPEKDKR